MGVTSNENSEGPEEAEEKEVDEWHRNRASNKPNAKEACRLM